jgi:hypothetical protein
VGKLLLESDSDYVRKKGNQIVWENIWASQHVENERVSRVCLCVCVVCETLCVVCVCVCVQRGEVVHVEEA